MNAASAIDTGAGSDGRDGCDGVGRGTEDECGEREWEWSSGSFDEDAASKGRYVDGVLGDNVDATDDVWW